MQLRRERRVHIRHGCKSGNDQRHWRFHGFTRARVRPSGFHRQRIFTNRNRNAQFRTQLHAHGFDRVVQLRVFTRHTTSRHPVGREFDLADFFNRRSSDIGNRFGNRHASRRRRIQHCQRRALAHRHRFTERTRVVAQRHGAVGHRDLIRPDHLIARGQATDGTIANGNQEVFIRHGWMAQYVQRDLAQIQADHIHRRAVLRHALYITGHFGWFAEQNFHRHLHGILRIDHALACIQNLQLPLGSRRANDRKRAALTFAHLRKQIQMLRQNRQHIALLRLIAPDFAWRQAGFLQLNFRQIKNRAFFRAVNDFREGVGNTARADIVDRQNRVVRAELPAAVDDLLRTALDFRVTALHRIKIELRAVRTRVHG